MAAAQYASSLIILKSLIGIQIHSTVKSNILVAEIRTLKNSIIPFKEYPSLPAKYYSSYVVQFSIGIWIRITFKN